MVGMMMFVGHRWYNVWRRVATYGYVGSAGSVPGWWSIAIAEFFFQRYPKKIARDQQENKTTFSSVFFFPFPRFKVWWVKINHSSSWFHLLDVPPRCSGVDPQHYDPYFMENLTPMERPFFKKESFVGFERDRCFQRNSSKHKENPQKTRTLRKGNKQEDICFNLKNIFFSIWVGGEKTPPICRLPPFDGSQGRSRQGKTLGAGWPSRGGGKTNVRVRGGWGLKFNNKQLNG